MADDNNFHKGMSFLLFLTVLGSNLIPVCGEICSRSNLYSWSSWSSWSGWPETKICDNGCCGSDKFQCCPVNIPLAVGLSIAAVITAVIVAIIVIVCRRRRTAGIVYRNQPAQSTVVVQSNQTSQSTMAGGVQPGAYPYNPQPGAYPYPPQPYNPYPTQPSAPQPYPGYPPQPYGAQPVAYPPPAQPVAYPPPAYANQYNPGYAEAPPPYDMSQQKNTGMVSPS
ncbi:protein shisa-5-like [Physella acuta]|uniref:protein shisa-5-like n=1 Tax=Physella acuta TaxID=109671 RepID=UPI0027DCD989|nr:protein shisa-5-like [Physella acuta]